MGPFLTNGNLAPFLFRQHAERAIRARCSENTVLELHDGSYAPLKQATLGHTTILEAVEEAAERVGLTSLDANAIHPDVALRSLADTTTGGNLRVWRRPHRTSLAELRRLLDDGAKERDLQNGLVATGLLAVAYRVVQEVTMNATKDNPGMRMDLVLEAEDAQPTQIVELKRGKHLLLARTGKPTQRLSQQLKKALRQLRGYGHRLGTDSSATKWIRDKHGLRVNEPELRLVAGRRLSNAAEYLLLTSAESDATASGFQLQIYTWDAFLAELERIVD